MRTARRPRPFPAALATIVLALLVSGGLAGGAAHAHSRSLSYSSVELAPEGASVRVRIPQAELLALSPGRLLERAEAGLGGELGGYLARRLRVISGGRPCAVSGSPRRIPSTAGWVLYEWRVACGEDEPNVLECDLLVDLVPGHLHFARVRLGDGRVLERVFSAQKRRWTLPLGTGDEGEARPAEGGSTLAEYVGLGVEHILSGWDHLAFVLALLLLAGSVGEVAVLVTAFTAAHSVTLALRVLGVVRPDPTTIEALIGFSIALLSVENLWLMGGRDRIVPRMSTVALLLLAALALLGLIRVPALVLAGLALFSFCHFALLAGAARPAPIRAAVGFAFGLVHGFGFAGILTEMGLPTARLVPALLGFNAGVELGQLAVVGLTWPLLRLLARPRLAAPGRLVAETGSAAACALGLFWLLTRAIG